MITFPLLLARKFFAVNFLVLVFLLISTTTELFFQYSRELAPCAFSMTVVSASVLGAIRIPSFEVVEDDLFDVPLLSLRFLGVAGSFKKAIK